MIRERSIDLPGGRFQLLGAGDGARLVVVLHGFPDHPPSFRRVIERIAGAGYAVAAPWMRGYAPSTLAGPYHVDRLATDLLDLATALGHERFAVVGHDWGAVATYAACLIAPERIATAVTLAIPHPMAFRRPGQLVRSLYMPALAAPGGAFVGRFVIDALYRLWSPRLRLDRDDRAALLACLAASWPAPARYYRALLTSTVAARRFAHRIDTPVLAIHGADDGCVSTVTAERQAPWFGGPFELQILPGVGHFLQIEAPDRVADLALGWISNTI